MKYEPTRNSFAQNARDKAQDAIDHAREVREKKLADRGKSKTEPRLIADGKLERCSVCGYPFEADVKPSMSCAFAEHVLKTHRPGQTSEDVNQAAARIASETTEN
jgi:rubrerythrin